MYQSLNEVFAERGIQNPITTGEQIIHVFAEWLHESPVLKYLDEMELVETRKIHSFTNFKIITISMLNPNQLSIHNA